MLDRPEEDRQTDRQEVDRQVKGEDRQKERQGFSGFHPFLLASSAAFVFFLFGVFYFSDQICHLYCFISNSFAFTFELELSSFMFFFGWIDSVCFLLFYLQFRTLFLAPWFSPCFLVLWLKRWWASLHPHIHNIPACRVDVTSVCDLQPLHGHNTLWWTWGVGITETFLLPHLQRKIWMNWE